MRRMSRPHKLVWLILPALVITGGAQYAAAKEAVVNRDGAPLMAA